MPGLNELKMRAKFPKRLTEIFINYNQHNSFFYVLFCFVYLLLFSFVFSFFFFFFFFFLVIVCLLQFFSFKKNHLSVYPEELIIRAVAGQQ